MSQNANTTISGLTPDSQYLPLTASPSLAFISLHDIAANSGMEPRGAEIETKPKNIKQAKIHNTTDVSESSWRHFQRQLEENVKSILRGIWQ